MLRFSARGALIAALALPAASGAGTLIPDLSAATFLPGAPIDNRYFPVVTGSTAVLKAEGTDDEGATFTERSELTGMGAGRVLMGVQTQTVLDRAYEDGLLVEETHDYYAQDTDGNVWYFGEDVTNYVYDDSGALVDTNSASSWLAGVNGALPGFIMPADPQLGFAYFQEFAAADGALDQAEILALDRVLSVPYGDFTGVLVVAETTQLEPGVIELKYYAPGIGLIREDEGVDEAFGNPERVFQLTSVAPVPLPPALPALAAALAALGLLRRPRR